MNAIHDLGGMHGFGPVRPEAPGAPAFHAEWERRAFALTLAMGATGAWNLDQSRAMRESLPPLDYLRLGYYGIWFAALERLLLERGLVVGGELASGHVQAPGPRLPKRLAADAVAAVLARGAPTERPDSDAARVAPRFAAGEAVVTVNRHPTGHTRLPRYARGRRGTIEAVRGVHVLADAHALLPADEAPQWLYTVRFAATELWGPDTTADAVCVDCWESALRPAGQPAEPAR